MVVQAAELRDVLAAQAFGAWLSRMRDVTRLRQKDVKERLQSAPYYHKFYEKDIYAWEKGERLPKAPVIEDLISILGGRNTFSASLILDYGLNQAQSVILGQDLKGADIVDAATLELLIQKARAFGVELAHKLALAQKERAMQSIEAIPEEKRAEALALLERLYHEAPERAEELLRFGRFLSESDPDQSTGG